MSKCKRIQDRLAASGPIALREDIQAQEHLVECDACYRFLENLDQIEQGLASLPPLDAPDRVVAQLLERDELFEPVTTAPRREPWYRSPLFANKPKRRVRLVVWGGGGLVSASLLLVLVALTNVSPEKMILSQSRTGHVLEHHLSEVPPDLTPQQIEALKSLGYIAGNGGSGPANHKAPGDQRPKVTRRPPPEPTPEPPSLSVKNQVVERLTATTELDKTGIHSIFSDEFSENLPVPDRFHESAETVRGGVQDADDNGKANVHGSRNRQFKAIVGGVSKVDPLTGQVNSNSIEEMEVITAGAGGEFSRAEGGLTKKIQERWGDESALWVLDGVEFTDLAATEGGSYYFDYNEFEKTASTTGRSKKKQAPAKDELRADDRRAGDKFGDKIRDGREVGQDRAFDKQESRAIAEARLFIEERNATEGLEFREATGYWSNRYVPGDPLMRLLHARLQADSSGFDARVLHAAVRATFQPLDAPQHAAIAVQLQADRRAAEGPARTLVQVGIKGIEHQGGRRPAMNLAVVLDLEGETSNEVATGMRAIADALNAARRPGDRFRLIVAGAPGGVAVDAHHFRHGELRVALTRLFDPRETLDGPTWDLPQAMTQAIGLVAQDDDPTATLGTSAVLLVTGRSLDTHADRLNDLAHRSAIAGIPVGALAIGANSDPTQLERLTVSGQGRLGILLRPADAEALVDRELAAVSRAVARAVRLRIRLAPGVELIEVIGSKRLDERAADRVRQSESSLDLRLARNLGISADRGEDEDGIQIIIPNFYAADEHVILLDVLAPGAGALVDVTARFKDLVHLKNGTVRASLNLDRGADTQGRAELNVLKNYLAHELSETLRFAGSALARQDQGFAEALLRNHERLLTGLAFLMPIIHNDPEIEADLALLVSYREALTHSGITQEQLSWLADSLRYASGARLLTPEPTERNPS